MALPRLSVLLVLAACTAPDSRSLGGVASPERLVETTATTLNGPTSSGTEYGAVLAAVGDLNADGYEDLAVGATADGSGYGRVYVYYGSHEGLDPVAGATLGGSASGAMFGSAIAGVGDLNGDGYDDLAVGEYGYSSSTGRVYLYYGSASGVPTTASMYLQGLTASSQFGYSVSGGTLDSDGYSDVVVGAPGYSSGAGRVYTYRGAASGPSVLATATISGESSGNFGAAVLGSVDATGDTYNELVVSAPAYNSDTGRVYVFGGEPGGPRTSYGGTFDGEATGDRYGEVLVHGGNFNNDIFEDVVIGAPGHSSDTGRVYAYIGGRTGFNTTAAWTADGSGSGAFGASIAAGYDADYDGYDDVAVGEPDRSSAAGRVSAFPGNGSGFDSADATWSGSSGDGTGTAIAWGDFNGDGSGDLAIGSPGADRDVGEVVVYPGTGAHDLDGDGVDAHTDCNDLDEHIFPGHADLPADGIDNDCDGYELCYADVDADGYRPDRDATVLSADLDCTDPGEAEAITPVGDCDDEDASLNPGAREIVGDGLDQDCDGADDCYMDADGDGFASMTATVRNLDGDCDDAPEVPSTTPGGDCDDINAAINPDASDATGDGIDSNCDGSEVCYVDADDDGYRPDASSTVTSDDPDCDDAGEALADDPTGDCNDGAFSTHPGARDVGGDGVDQNCDGVDEDAEADTGDTGGGDTGGDDTGDTAADSGSDTDAVDTDGDHAPATAPGDGKDAGKGCGCTSTGPDGGGAVALVVAGLALARRRRG